MLVLTRKKNEQILIGDSITITVVEVQGGRIKLGIDAPNSCRILRAELPASTADDSSSEPAAQDVSGKLPAAMVSSRREAQRAAQAPHDSRFAPRNGLQVRDNNEAVTRKTAK